MRYPLRTNGSLTQDCRLGPVNLIRYSYVLPAVCGSFLFFQRKCLRHLSGGPASTSPSGWSVLRASKNWKSLSPRLNTMPSPFAGQNNYRKVTPEELIRAIRFMVAAEYEAVQMYMQLAESTENKLAIQVLKGIADEERVHAGEFLRLLRFA